MYNWSDYVDPDNMEAFKAEFGVKNFVYDTFANNDELLAKLAAGASGYDMSPARPRSSCRRWPKRATSRSWTTAGSPTSSTSTRPS